MYLYAMYISFSPYNDFYEGELDYNVMDRNKRFSCSEQLCNIRMTFPYELDGIAY